MDLQVGHDIGSDHFPLYAKLMLEVQNENKEIEPPSNEELKAAEEQIEKEEEKNAEEKKDGDEGN
jgi:hypothetical protein